MWKNPERQGKYFTIDSEGFFFIEIVWIFCFLHQNTLLYQFLNLFKLNKNSLSFIILKFRHLNLTKKSNY